MMIRVMVLISLFVFGWMASTIDAAGIRSAVSEEKLIVSNYPESVSHPGLMLKETWPAGASLRLVYHHRNRSSHELAIQVVLENPSNEVVTVNLVRGDGGPSVDEVFTGHIATKRFVSSLLSKKRELITLEAGHSKTVVLHGMKAAHTVTGILRLRQDTDKDLKISLRVIDPIYPELSGFVDTWLGEEVFSFGAFDETVRETITTFDVSENIDSIRIGGEPFLEDKHRNITLRGNYGLFYDVQINFVNSGKEPRRVNLFFTPAAGNVRGVLVINGKLMETEFLESRRQIEISQKLFMTVVQPNEVQTLRLQMMPQPGSFYPVQLVMRGGNIRARAPIQVSTLGSKLTGDVE